MTMIKLFVETVKFLYRQADEALVDWFERTRNDGPYPKEFPSWERIDFRDDVLYKTWDDTKNQTNNLVKIHETLAYAKRIGDKEWADELQEWLDKWYAPRLDENVKNPLAYE